MRSQRYSRHWYDLVAIAQSAYYESAVSDRDLARKVAEHKSLFFSEKGAQGGKIDYFRAAAGAIQLVPSGDSLTALERDYAAMLEDGLVALNQQNFADLMEGCRAIEARINAVGEAANPSA